MAREPFGHYHSAARPKPNSIDRRRFMGWLATGLFGAWSAPLTTFGGSPQRRVHRTSNPQRVLVIGAGISGLAAARTLADIGHDVLVIESRDRIGGRIDTSNSWADAPVDLGASWIHGTNNNPIAQIAQQIGAQTVATNGNASEIYGPDGSVLTSSAYNRLMQLQNQVEQIVAAGQNANMDRPLRETVENGIGFGQLSVQDQQFVNFILSETEHDSAGSAESLSTYWFDNPDYFSGAEVVFPTGYGVITDHLATGLAIEFGHTVSEIAVHGGGVTVLSQRGIHTGDLAVVTLPLGVLKAGTVSFTPGLPAAMQQAIDTLQMGVLNKAYLRFPSVFWPQNLDWMQQVSQNHGEWVNWLNIHRVLDEPILMGFNAADFGLEIESWSDQDILASGMEKLRALFGTNIPEPVDSQITRWGADPHTRGSYSFLPDGAHPSMRDALAGTLENRVFFAGEATNRQYYPTVHGAYLSGLAAAENIESTQALFADGFESGDTSRWTLTTP